LLLIKNRITNPRLLQEAEDVFMLQSTRNTLGILSIDSIA
jgi:hypothetical protein